MKVFSFWITFIIKSFILFFILYRGIFLYGLNINIIFVHSFRNVFISFFMYPFEGSIIYKYLFVILYITMKWFIPFSVIIWAIHGKVISLLWILSIFLPIPFSPYFLAVFKRLYAVVPLLLVFVSSLSISNGILPL